MPKKARLPSCGAIGSVHSSSMPAREIRFGIAEDPSRAGPVGDKVQSQLNKLQHLKRSPGIWLSFEVMSRVRDWKHQVKRSGRVCSEQGMALRWSTQPLHPCRFRPEGHSIFGGSCLSGRSESQAVVMRGIFRGCLSKPSLANNILICVFRVVGSSSWCSLVCCFLSRPQRGGKVLPRNVDELDWRGPFHQLNPLTSGKLVRSFQQLLFPDAADTLGSVQNHQTVLQKPDGGVRGIATGTSFRRLVAKTLARQFGKAVEAVCVPYQFALSTRAGTDCVGHAIRALDADPQCTVLSIDGVGAYDHVLRSCTPCPACRGCCLL